jgi:copper ion binding protein
MNTIRNTATYRVNGMTCGHCVRAIRAEVGAVDGVRDVEVNLPEGTVTVHSLAPLPHESMAAAIHDAGYDLIAGGRP